MAPGSGVVVSRMTQSLPAVVENDWVPVVVMVMMGVVQGVSTPVRGLYRYA